MAKSKSYGNLDSSSKLLVILLDTIESMLSGFNVPYWSCLCSYDIPVIYEYMEW